MGPDLAFGMVLRELRAEKGISQEALAHACGLHRTYMSLLERGLRSPTLRTLFALAEALEIEPEEIVRRVRRSGRHR